MLLNEFNLLRAVEIIFAISLLLQGAEFLCMRSASAVSLGWSWSVQREDLCHTAPWLRRFFDLAFRPEVYRAHLFLRMAVSFYLLLYGGTIFCVLFLFFGTLCILIRWRGAFNGGSDFMTLVVITGLMIARLGAPWLGDTLAFRAGLLYIAIQALSSYFLSGTVKLFYDGWRDGRALPALLDGGIYGPLKPDSIFRRQSIARVCSWAFIVWECVFPLTMISPRWTLIWCLLALGFHFLVFWYFGLNRFFWAWAATLPAIIYCATCF